MCHRPCCDLKCFSQVACEALGRGADQVLGPIQIHVQHAAAGRGGCRLSCWLVSKGDKTPQWTHSQGLRMGCKGHPVCGTEDQMPLHSVEEPFQLWLDVLT